MRKKNNEGSSLLEIVIAIAVLAATVIPVCSSLVMSHKVNAKTEKLMQAQLEVSSVVETLMAKGIPENYHELTGLLGVSDTATKEEKSAALAKLVERGITEEARWWIDFYIQHPEAAIAEREKNLKKPDEKLFNYYKVTVTSATDDDVVVETVVRAAAEVAYEVSTEEPEQGGGT